MPQSWRVALLSATQVRFQLLLLFCFLNQALLLLVILRQLFIDLLQVLLAVVTGELLCRLALRCLELLHECSHALLLDLFFVFREFDHHLHVEVRDFVHYLLLINFLIRLEKMLQRFVEVLCGQI